MRYLSLFSGIEAATVAWEPLGWECVAVADIEPFSCALLKHYYASVPNLGDVTTITKEQIEALGHIDIVIFGSPCQDLSTAGNRAGLAGARSGLFHSAMQIVRWSKARFALWENVMGAFSSNSRADFGAVVGEMAGTKFETPKKWHNSGIAIGPDAQVEWCVLDAAEFGLAQRRKRVFALRDTGDWQSRRPILIDQNCLQGNPAKSSEPGKDTAGDPQGDAGSDSEPNGCFITTTEGTLGCPTFTCANISTVSNQTPLVVYPLQDGYNHCVGDPGDPSYTLSCIDKHAIAFTVNDYGGDAGEVSPTLKVGTKVGVSTKMTVRRLTPLECERLQGFPDNYTAITYRKKPAADSPRYRALGNSMAVPVIRWIGESIRSRLTESCD